MKKVLALICLLLLAGMVTAAEEQTAETAVASATTDSTIDEMNPWNGKYCMSFLNKARSTKVLPEGRLSLSLKYRLFEADRKETSQGNYSGLPGNDWKDWQGTVFCAKYGWLKDHHIAVGVPVLCNDFNLGGTTRINDSGLGNIFVFEKWNFFKETNTLPSLSADVWVFFPTGDVDEKRGTEDYSYRATTSISKAWKDFSLHLNPGYTWNEKSGDNDFYEVNAALLMTPNKTFWPTLEYNYVFKEGLGHSNDIIPGFIWKYRKGGSFKAGAVVNLDSTMTYKDRVGLVLKIYQMF